MIKKIIKTEKQWRQILGPEQFQVMRKHGTETAFSCTWEKHGRGTYQCSACNLPLFNPKAKFNSKTGWPSYFQPIKSTHIIEHDNQSLGMSRIEVLCARCDSHLGHVFNDGPLPTQKRYCINSIALNFIPHEK